jgi:phospholipid transport system substrate-binding protein
MMFAIRVPFFALILGLLLLSAAWAGTPTEAVRDTSQEVMRLLHDPELAAPDRTEDRRRMLDDIIGARLTYEEISRRVLGKHWDTLSAGERAEFVGAFRALLCNMYASKIEAYGGTPLQLLGCSLERSI